MTPEQRLCVSALLMAIKDYAIRTHPKFRERYKENFKYYWALIIEIEDFFFDEELDDVQPGSFPWMCQAITDDWENIRSKILKYLQDGDFSEIFLRSKCHKVYKSLFN